MVESLLEPKLNSQGGALSRSAILHAPRPASYAYDEQPIGPDAWGINRPRAKGWTRRCTSSRLSRDGRIDRRDRRCWRNRARLPIRPSGSVGERNEG